MKHSDHFLITEAWRKAEQFEQEVEKARVLKLHRMSKPSLLHYRSAQVLMWLAVRLDPSLKRDNGLPSLERC